MISVSVSPCGGEGVSADCGVESSAQLVFGR